MAFRFTVSVNDPFQAAGDAALQALTQAAIAQWALYLRGLGSIDIQVNVTAASSGSAELAGGGAEGAGVEPAAVDAAGQREGVHRGGGGFFVGLATVQQLVPEAGVASDWGAALVKEIVSEHAATVARVLLGPIGVEGSHVQDAVRRCAWLRVAAKFGGRNLLTGPSRSGRWQKDVLPGQGKFNRS